MEIFFLLAGFSIFILPLILSITAIVKVGNLRNEINALRRQLEMNQLLKSRPPAASPANAPARKQPPAVNPVPPPPPPTPASMAVPAPVEPPKPPPPPIIVKPPEKPKAAGEFVFGGRIASFAGIGLLLTGIAFLVGYAIKHAWLGPEARVVLGLICGAVLVGLGHLAEMRGKAKLYLLARALTGGGSAIFYFCVFAAFGIYHLIGATLAGIGLVLSATAALGLAMAYRSQAVALIGVIGAFLMPPLIGREAPNTLFLLTYIAAINFPVLALGIYRNWQALYNTAFGFTALYLFGQLSGFDREDGALLLVFTVVYFFQFAGLGLFKLRAEREITGRNVDIVRLLLNSLGLLGALYLIMEKMEWDAWTGAAFLAAAVVHILLVRVGWKWRPSYTQDQLAFLVGALTLASLALPVQLDGAWVSLGWSIEGAILCWFALRARIPLLQVAAVLLGVIGLMKPLLFDLQFYPETPQLFLNARFISGIVAAALLGWQAAMFGRQPSAREEKYGLWWNVLPAFTVIAVLLVCTVDIFWTLGERHIGSWILSSLILLTVATISALFLKELPYMDALCRGLLLLIPLKLVWDILSFNAAPDWASQRLFINTPFLVLAVMSLFVLLILPRLLRTRAATLLDGTPNFAVTLGLFSLFSAILVVTAEIYRLPNDWNQTLVTLWWAVCAIALVAFGMIRRRRSHRYAGLWLFGAMTVKVLLVDLAALSGLERIAAFIGAGVVLLILSFVYQRASEWLIEEASK